MNNSIKILIIIAALIGSIILLWLGFQNSTIQEEISIPVKLSSYLENAEYCQEDINTSCLTTAEFRGELINNKLTINGSELFIESTDSNNTETYSGRIAGTSIITTIYLIESFEGEAGYTQQPISKLAQLNSPTCVDLKYYFFKKIPTDTEIESIEFNNEEGYLEIFPCFDEEQQKQDFFKKIELELLD